MTPAQLTTELKAEAARLGFALAGACPAVEPAGISRMQAWLEAGYGGQMLYLADRHEAYADPSRVLDGVRSVVMLALSYRTSEPVAVTPGSGRISRYAWGTDYHDVIRDRINRLAAFLVERVPTARARGVVDTAPLLEREFAQLAGLGWIGKNTLLLDKRLGSWFFLAALLTDQELVYDSEHATDHCGTCTACLDACPTDAFVAPYVLDARKCISYLTIELKGPIPVELRPGIGEWAFGCDVCQDVCPWNHKAPIVDDPAFEPRAGTNPLDLVDLLALDETAFRAHFKHTPLWRAKRRGLLRNAAIVLGNQRDSASLPALIRSLDDIEPLVRGAAAWALGQFDDDGARGALHRHRLIEQDSEVLAEIDAALSETLLPPGEGGCAAAG